MALPLDLFGGGAEEPQASAPVPLPLPAPTGVPTGAPDAESAGVLSIVGSEIRSRTPEGEARTAKVADLVERLRAESRVGSGLVLPDGVKALFPFPGGLALVHQTSPRVFGLRWIAPDSPEPFGKEAKYIDVRIALPYVITFAVFDEDRRGLPNLGGRNECFFSNQSLDAKGVATPLCYPALLNCSRMPDMGAHPLSWICTQYLPASEHSGATDPESALRRGLGALLRHLFESGFNRSSEHHELSSWYTASVEAGIDPRIASMEAWQAATSADPLFPLEVAWLPTKHDVRGVAARIAKGAGRRARRLSTAADLTRFLFQRRPQRSNR